MESIIIQSIVESMPIGLMVIDPVGRIIVANAALCSILGRDREEMKHKGWGELFILEDRNLDFNQVFIDVILREMVDLRRSVPYENSSGGLQHLSVTSSYLKVDGGLVGIVLLVEDVTEKHVLHVRETQMLSTMNQLQRERSEGLNKLALSVAHQIRNPMATIGGFAHMLMKTKPQDRASTESLEIILSELRKLENIVRVVTQYASIPQAQPRPVQLKALLENSAERLVATAQALGREAKVTIDCPADALVDVDPASFPSVLDAVLLNALEAAQDHSAASISLAASQSEGSMQLTIADAGKGIAAEDLSFVFDPFFTTKPQAVGMGLCLAKRVVLEHHGDIVVASRPGNGVEVSIRLPEQW